MSENEIKHGVIVLFASHVQNTRDHESNISQSNLEINNRYSIHSLPLEGLKKRKEASLTKNTPDL